MIFIKTIDNLPPPFSLCDLKINSSSNQHNGYRYIKHSDGYSYWYHERGCISEGVVTHWKLNYLDSKKLTQEWIDSLPFKGDLSDFDVQYVNGSVTYN